MVSSEWKEFAPKGAFFPFRVNSHSEERRIETGRVASPESVPIHLNYKSLISPHFVNTVNSRYLDFGYLE